MFKRIVFTVVTTLFPSALLNAETSVIPVWTRGNGDHSDNNEIKEVKLQTFDLKKIKLRQLALFDFQYGSQAEYRGVGLKDILTSYGPDATTDLVLLRFANGMIIPLPMDLAMQSKGPFIAYQMKNKKVFESQFPKVEKKDENWNDPRPTTFGHNKVVVPDGSHPFLPEKQAGESGKPKLSTTEALPFSPWRHVDSLVGIELVASDAYYAQFKPKASLDGGKGLEVWRARCQFCHGLDSVGAKFGWDFLRPVPIYKLKKPEHLYNMVKYSYHDAIMRGLMMPQQTDVEKGEMYVLWGWLKALDRSGIKPYRADR